MPIIVKADGTIVIMACPVWSLEKYEPELLNPDYELRICQMMHRL